MSSMLRKYFKKEDASFSNLDNLCLSDGSESTDSTPVKPVRVLQNNHKDRQFSASKENISPNQRSVTNQIGNMSYSNPLKEKSSAGISSSRARGGTAVAAAVQPAQPLQVPLAVPLAVVMNDYSAENSPASVEVKIEVPTHSKPVEPSAEFEAANESKVDLDLDSVFSKVRHGRYKQVKEALVAGFDPESRDENGNTLLHICAQNNHPKVASLVVRFGCPRIVHNKKMMTALDYANLYKNSEFLDWFNSTETF